MPRPSGGRPSRTSAQHPSAPTPPPPPLASGGSPAALARPARLPAAIRERGFGRGALRIESPEVTFEFDGRGSVARAWKESEPTSHRLVEELMIAANEAVAGLLSSRRREALYRVHERPDPQAVELLLKKLADLGVPTPPAPAQLTSALAAE